MHLITGGEKLLIADMTAFRRYYSSWPKVRILDQALSDQLPAGCALTWWRVAGVDPVAAAADWQVRLPET